MDRWLCVCGAYHDGPPRSVGAGFLMHEPKVVNAAPCKSCPHPLGDHSGYGNCLATSCLCPGYEPA